MLYRVPAPALRFAPLLALALVIGAAGCDASGGAEGEATESMSPGDPGGGGSGGSATNVGTDSTVPLDGEGEPAPEGGGCLEVATDRIDFGMSPVGSEALANLALSNCGTLDVRISSFDFGGESDAFALDCTLMASGTCPTAESPLVLGEAEEAILRVLFAPEGTTDDALADLDVASLTVESDAAGEAPDITVIGEAVAPSCPIPRIEIDEGEQVAPVTTLHLSGADSSSPGGEITAWQWFVMGPSGGANVVLPSSSHTEPFLHVDLAGTYEIHLRVWDETGMESCAEEVATVEVVPDAGIHVELVWESEGDEGGGIGTDVDLHLLHPKAEGLDRDDDGQGDGWFHLPWDCFWFNPNPSAWAEGYGGNVGLNPELLRDDQFGDGPEVLRVSEPLAGAEYRLGVHFWEGNGFPSSTVRLKVYILGEKVSDVGNVTLVESDLWFGAKIHWPSGFVEVPQKGQSLHVTPDYPMPEEFLP